MKAAIKHAYNYLPVSTEATPLEDAVEMAQKTKEKVLAMERKNAKNILHNADTYNQAIGEYINTCSDNLKTLAESVNAVSCAVLTLNNEIMESWSRSVSEYVGISNKVLACRTINDMVELQDKAMQQMSNNYFNTSNKLYDVLFDSCNQAMEPINERIAAGSKQVHKALAE